MGRPTYEDNKKKEREFAEDIAKHFNIELQEFGRFSIADYVFTRNNKVLGLAELKVRAIAAKDHPSLLVSYKKVEKALLLGRHFGTKFTMFWRCADGDYYYTFKKDQDAKCLEIIYKSGRTVQTRDAWDVEPCVHVPLDKCVRF